MTNITIPMPKDYINFIDFKINKGDYDSRSQFIRNSIKKMIEEDEINEVLEASRLSKMGELFEGDLDNLAKKHGY